MSDINSINDMVATGGTADDYWKSWQNQEPGVITRAQLEAFWEECKNYTLKPHMHIVSGNGGWCSCGTHFNKNLVDDTKEIIQHITRTAP